MLIRPLLRFHFRAKDLHEGVLGRALAYGVDVHDAAPTFQIRLKGFELGVPVQTRKRHAVHFCGLFRPTLMRERVALPFDFRSSPTMTFSLPGVTSIWSIRTSSLAEIRLPIRIPPSPLM